MPFVTLTGPVVAPEGTATVIAVPVALTVKEDVLAPVKAIVVAPMKLVPVTVIEVPGKATAGANGVLAKVGALVGVTVKAVLAAELRPEALAISV
jgi:hypothetical protein